MKVIDVCSGIGTTAVAWHPLGWEHLCFAEIEKFPSAVLKHCWPGIMNEGDFTKIGDKYRGAADLLAGGTPCQSFSVAGLRGGLADDRGNLALEFLRLADRTRPRWVVWENVPGVLSSNRGRDFGSILGGLAQLRYGWAYRILDAQHFGVPQRRRRVFVVGCLGDWRAAAAVLFERHSLQGNHPPRRKKGQEIAGTIGGSSQSGGFRTTDLDNSGSFIVGALQANGKAAGSATQQDAECGMLVTHSLRADGFDASEDGTDRGTPIVPVGMMRESGQGYWMEDTVTGTLDANMGQSGHANRVATIAFTQNQRDEVRLMDVASALASEPGMKQQTYVQGGMAVRRLTPRECERLQGLPDDHTLVPFNGKPAADGPRYKAIGNGMAVPVVKWIGQRIQLFEERN